VVSASSESQPRFKFFDLDGGEDVGKAVDLSPNALSRYSRDTWKACGQDDGLKRRE